MVEPYCVFSIFCGLLLGGLLREVNKKTAFSYTVMLIIIGFLGGYFRSYLGIFGYSNEIFSHISPYLAFLILVPVLTFEGCFNTDWYIFKRSITNILILAIFGVMLNSLLIGLAFKLILGYSDLEMSWSMAFMLGAILSPTDPSSVLSILKSLGVN